MIAEIGLVLSLYVLARLIPPTKASLSKWVSRLALAVTVLVILDLMLRVVWPDGIASLLPRDQRSTSSTRPILAGKSSAASTASVTRADGGSITTQLGYGIAVAKGSSLKREWIAVHNSTMPVAFEGTPGVSTVYARRQYGGEYRYQTRFTINTREAIRALQVRFLTFDVWGEHVRTLSFEEVVDIPEKSKKELVGEWSLYSENDAEKHYASIAYIARVRLVDGRVSEAPTDAVIEEARKFSSKFTAAQLEPKPATSPEGREKRG